MGEFIIQIIIGLVIIIIGIFNMKGNISLLHSYHRKRVKKEDIIPFGKKLGIGSVIIGITIILTGVFTNLNYTNISNVILVIGLVTGFIIIFYAMFKYNKGIF
ncbi:MAG: hypothetical protein IJ966_01660 [Bacilli bacterium]|nr:hypothetical protein [Bacilli bacterium]